MVTKTFNGNGGSLTDGTNWTPPGVPLPGDTAVMSSGSGILGDSNLNGDTLLFGHDFSGTEPPPNLTLWNATLDLENQGLAEGTVSAADGSTLNINRVASSEGATLTVNIADSDQLDGTLAAPVFRSLVTINGPTSVYNHSGTTDLTLGGRVELNTNVLGTGDWNLSFVSELTTNGLFTETVTDQGGALDVKTPTLFTGQINLINSVDSQPVTQVSLEGLFATAATYDGSTLSLLFGSEVIDQVKISDPNSFKVYQAPTGVQIFAGEPSTPVTFPLLLQT
ncbi:MAG: hypothetical protein JO227_14770 [Acetobacteraceae bacterium]|nr:hypothetical protein [Acetobacteraceae bacterium]